MNDIKFQTLATKIRTEANIIAEKTKNDVGNYILVFPSTIEKISLELNISFDESVHLVSNICNGDLV
jgi:hypothetical protein